MILLVQQAVPMTKNTITLHQRQRKAMNLLAGLQTELRRQALILESEH